MRRLLSFALSTLILNACSSNDSVPDVVGSLGGSDQMAGGTTASDPSRGGAETSMAGSGSKHGDGAGAPGNGGANGVAGSPNSAGAASGGATNGGASNGGTSNGGASNGGTSNGGAASGGTTSAGGANGGTSNGGNGAGGSPGVGCVNDKYEPNDRLELAVELPTGDVAYAAVLCPGDMDYFRKAIAPSGIRVNVAGANQAVELSWISPAGDVVKSVQTDAKGNATLCLPGGQQGGMHYVRVTSASDVPVAGITYAIGSVVGDCP